MALVLVMACAPSLAPAPSSAPALDPAQINQIIAQTANAASTQTVQAIPTNTITDTPVPTSTPFYTKTVEPTATETLIYIYYTPTSFVVPTVGPTKPYKPESNKSYACKILIAPKQNEYYNPRVQFKVKWRVQNIGRMDWEKPNVLYEFDYGDKFHIVDSYIVPWDTVIGDLADLFVEMQAPKNPGTYTAHWTMVTAGQKFCNMTLTINVVE